MMRVHLKGEVVNLRKLSDEEYDEADSLARQIKGSKGLDYCPTCKTKQSDDPSEIAINIPQYKFRGNLYQCDCQAQIALFARYLLGGIPEQYMRLEWEDYDGSAEAREFVDNYLDKWQNYRDHGFGVEFGGLKLGIGKTFAATHILKEMVKHRQRVLFVPWIELISAFRRSDAEAFEDRLRMTPYLLVDDITAPSSAKQHDLFATQLEAVIRHRTNYNLPTIITTNLEQDELEYCYPRTYSLLSAKQKRIDMDGQDFRSAIGFENEELIENGEVRPIT